MSHIQNDPEFRGIAHCCDRFQSGRVQGDRPQGGKLYSVGLWRGDVLWRFAGFDELLKVCDSRPASLTSIGRSTSATIAATMVPRPGQNPTAIPPRIQINSRRFMLAPPEGHHSSSYSDTGRGR